VERPRQRLTGVRLRDLKSFSDSDRVELRGLNLLVGANNAGKSTFLSAIELFFRSMRPGGGLAGPLAFETMPTFASFDSSLRRHWSRSAQRPNRILLDYEWESSIRERQTVLRYEFECRSQGTDDSIVVERATYHLGDKLPQVTATLSVDPDTGRPGYTLKDGKKTSKSEEQWFHQLMPFGLLRGRLSEMIHFSTRAYELEVVNPYRPVPRSFYVLDDPNLAAEDRSLLSYLIRLWASKDVEEKKTLERLRNSLSTLGLTRYFEVSQVSKKIGPKVVEIRVAPTSSRQKVTIADAGFGLSQVLPLAVYDARLSQGTLIAYQPEVHLHPFAQSRLADVFIDSLGRGNQLFVETHSVDLVLRLQTMIAEGKVKPEDVAVHCFENIRGRSKVYPMSFDEFGAPSRPWPSGFLDTSLRLARELTSARVQRRQPSGSTG
jgi:hypothetical protein